MICKLSFLKSLHLWKFDLVTRNQTNCLFKYYQGLYILEHGLAGFPQFGKKCHIKFVFVHQMEHQKIDPRKSTMFLK